MLWLFKKCMQEDFLGICRQNIKTNSWCSQGNHPNQLCHFCCVLWMSLFYPSSDRHSKSTPRILERRFRYFLKISSTHQEGQVLTNANHQTNSLYEIRVQLCMKSVDSPSVTSAINIQGFYFSVFYFHSSKEVRVRIVKNTAEAPVKFK